MAEFFHSSRESCETAFLSREKDWDIDKIKIMK